MGDVVVRDGGERELVDQELPLLNKIEDKLKRSLEGTRLYMKVSCLQGWVHRWRAECQYDLDREERGWPPLR